MRARRQVAARSGAIHAPVLDSLCHLAARLVAEVTVPATLTWSARGMTIEYLREARRAVTATARLEKVEWRGAEDVGVLVSVADAAGAEVVRAVVTLRVAPQK